VTPALFLAPTDVLGAVSVGSVIEVGGPEGRHAADVRRLRSGEPVNLSDGHGLLVHGSCVDVVRGRVSVRVHSRVTLPPRSPRFVVVQALARGGRDEDAVEAMTEVGLDEVVGWSASRAIAKWTDRTAGRWQGVVQAATKQSRSPWLPVVTGPATTGDVARRLGQASLGVVLHEEATEPLSGLDVPEDGDVVVVVGPEGGVAPDELDAFVAAGARACRLGDQVLRSSTAGVAALSVLNAKTRWR